MLRISPVMQLAVRLLLVSLLGLLLRIEAGVAQPPSSADRTRPSASAAAAEEPIGALSLSEALALGLSRSPALAEFSWELRATEARALQAGLFPNPEIGLEVEDVAGTGSFRGARQAQTTLRLSQLIELGGKRTARQDVAAAAHEVAVQEYEVRRVEVLSEIAGKFVQVLGAQHEVVLAREVTALAEAALKAARTRVRAGKASALEEKKAVIALARNRISHEHAEHMLLVARKELAATWASKVPLFSRVQGNLFELQEPPSFERLGNDLTTSPEIVRWVSEKRLREAEIALADAKRIPSVNVGAGFRRQEGPDAETFLFQFWLPLPIFDRNQGGAAEARAAAQRADAGEHSTAIRLHTVLFALYQELLHAATAMASLQRAILPEAKEALVLSQRGFSEGRYSYLELLDAQRTFVEVRQEVIETAVSYQQLLLGIERLIGQPLDGPSPQP